MFATRQVNKERSPITKNVNPASRFSKRKPKLSTCFPDIPFKRARVEREAAGVRIGTTSSSSSPALHECPPPIFLARRNRLNEGGGRKVRLRRGHQPIFSDPSRLLGVERIDQRHHHHNLELGAEDADAAGNDDEGGGGSGAGVVVVAPVERHKSCTKRANRLYEERSKRIFNC